MDDRVERSLNSDRPYSLLNIARGEDDCLGNPLSGVKIVEAIQLLQQYGYALGMGIRDCIDSPLEETHRTLPRLRRCGIEPLPDPGTKRSQMREALGERVSLEQYFDHASTEANYSLRKKPWLKLSVDQMQSAGMIGTHRVEIGCASSPFAWPSREGEKLVLVDRGKPVLADDRFSDALLIRADVDQDPEFLQIKRIQQFMAGRIDTILCSQVINYIPGIADCMREMVRALTAQGRLLIFNCPRIVGDFRSAAEDDERFLIDLVDNAQLIHLIEECGLTIELWLFGESSG